MDHLSQSGCATFRDCRKFAELRYERGIKQKEDDGVLSLGKLTHKALELYYSQPNWSEILRETLARENPKHPTYVDVVVAMMKNYAVRYNDHEIFEVVKVEHEFNIPLLNPETGAASRTFYRTGKIDLLVRKKSDGTIWLVEHKSASRVDAAYLRRLWLDFQITWYLEAAETSLGMPIAGVLYNMIEKPQTAKLVPDIGESEGEFEDRKKALKNPKAAKRKMPETRDEFLARIEDFYADPTCFSREEILLTKEDVNVMLQEAWDIGQAWIDARNKNRWYRNTSNCFKWNKPCPMLPICQSRENPAIIEANYLVEKKEEAKAF